MFVKILDSYDNRVSQYTVNIVYDCIFRIVLTTKDKLNR